ncbi:MAG: hypothetical protein GX682_06220 [Clostridiaceae bacterium]|nr:hypothetical protein [Clostridiaceae bacterium]
MGIFDKFKKEQKTIKKEIIQEEKTPYNIEKNITRDGKLQIDFYDRTVNKFKEFYDTTRIVIGENTEIVGGYEVQKALVSWYNQDDGIILNPQNKEEIGSRTQYE